MGGIYFVGSQEVVSSFKGDCYYLAIVLRFKD